MDMQIYIMYVLFLHNICNINFKKLCLEKSYSLYPQINVLYCLFFCLIDIHYNKINFDGNIFDTILTGDKMNLCIALTF